MFVVSSKSLLSLAARKQNGFDFSILLTLRSNLPPFGRTGHKLMVDFMSLKNLVAFNLKMFDSLWMMCGGETE